MMTFLYYLLFGIICFYLGANYKRMLLACIKYVKRKNNKDENKKEAEEEKDDEKYDFDDADLKMVFLVREDLKLGAGKIAAQVAHAAVGLYSEITLEGKSYYQQALEHWDEFGAKKIVLKAKDLDELRDIHNECKKKKIPSIIISDAGHTQVDPGTKTVLGIGPEASDILDKITGKFKLMR